MATCGSTNDVERAAVFLAGGIGITPFHRILLDAANRKLPHRIFLFFSNNGPEDAPFLDELQSLERRNANYKFIGTMTKMEESKLPWQGERGFINKEMLDKYLQNTPIPIYYIAGPPDMVKALRTMLKEAGIDDDDIRTGDFTIHWPLGRLAVVRMTVQIERTWTLALITACRVLRKLSVAFPLPSV